MRIGADAPLRVLDPDPVEQLRSPRPSTRCGRARGRRRSVSAICAPTRITGLSDLNGSWKIMPTDLRAQVAQLRLGEREHVARRRSGCCPRRDPPGRGRPCCRTRGRSGSCPSPTRRPARASSPASTARSTPLTATSGSSRRANSTRSASIASRLTACPRSRAAVGDPLADQPDADAEQHQHQPRQRRDPPGGEQVGWPSAMIAAELGGRRLHPEAEVGEAGRAGSGCRPCRSSSRRGRVASTLGSPWRGSRVVGCSRARSSPSCTAARAGPASRSGRGARISAQAASGTPISKPPTPGPTIATTRSPG